MSDEPLYSEHAKLMEVYEQSQACGDFFEWLVLHKGFMSVVEHEHDDTCYQDGMQICDFMKGDLIPVPHEPIEALLAQFFEIDLDKIEEEKRQMLKEARRTIRGTAKKGEQPDLFEGR
jgi:hypothetical protein